MNKIYLILVIGLDFFSCEEKKKSDSVFDEANSIFSKSMVEADLNYQIEEKKLYEEEFVNSWKISQDSMVNYVKFFKNLVDENFYFDGSTSLGDMKESKKKYDDYNLKFQNKGFNHFCQALGEWNDLYGKPEAEYFTWLRKHDFTRDEFERDILDVNLQFSQLCKIKSEKEKGKTLQD